MDRVAEQPDRAGQDREQQLDNAGGGQPDRADRDRPVGIPALLHVIVRAGEGKRGGRVTDAGGFMHPASMSGRPPRGKPARPAAKSRAAVTSGLRAAGP
jgi:hypothetical protein